MKSVSFSLSKYSDVGVSVLSNILTISRLNFRLIILPTFTLRKVRIEIPFQSKYNSMLA